MAFDGIIVSAVANELSTLLTGGKIEKIYQPEADELVFHIHSRSGNYKLYASSGSGHARFHILSKTLENPPSPSPFCMLLRKHLSGGRIARITQANSERILEISVDSANELGFSENKTLIFEIMGKHSNIILTDAGSLTIIDSIKRVSAAESRVRQILPGRSYEYPPEQDKIPLEHISATDIKALRECAPYDFSQKLLSGIRGISPGIAASLAAAQKPGDTSGENVYAELVSMRESLGAGNFKPAVYLDAAGAPVDFHIFPLVELEDSCQRMEFSGVSECVEYYYFSKTGLNRLKQKSADLDRAVKSGLDKLYLKKQRLSEDIMMAEKADLYRLYGELLTANLHILSTGANEARLTNYYDGAEIVIPLDKRFSPSQNARAYFKKYGKAKTAVKEKTLRLSENDVDIEYLESVYAFIENASSVEEIEALRSELVKERYLRGRKNREKTAKIKPAPFKYETSGGFKVMAGKNNTENDNLTFKSAARTDLWFHTKDIPGSHVILFTNGASPGETDIWEAASIAAFHSKGKSSENIPVDYTKVKHVKKPSGAKPGMVIFTNNKTVYVNPKLPEGS